MERYFKELHRQEPLKTITMNKYIRSYSEKHQSQEEKQSDTVAKQNFETQNILRRSYIIRSTNTPPKLQVKNATKRSDSTAMKRSDSTAMKRSDSTLMKRSDSTEMKLIDISATKRSDITAMKRSDITARKRSDNIATQHNATVVQPGDIIKFELSDAAVPDKETEEVIQQGKVRNSKLLTHETEPQEVASKKVKKDMSAAESIIIKVKHPAAARQESRKVKSIASIPIGVKNVIKMVMKQPGTAYSGDGLYKDQSIAGQRYGYNSIAINDKSPATSYVPLTIKGYTYQPWWQPRKIEKSRKLAYRTKPVPHHESNYLPQNAYPKPAVQYEFPPNYFKDPVYDLGQHQSYSPQQNTGANIYYSANELKTQAPFKIEIPDEPEVQDPSGYYTNPKTNIPALTSLIGKPAAFQLNGLTEILKEDSNRQRPQDSTAPVLFPLGARLPLPRTNNSVSFITNNFYPTQFTAPLVSAASDTNYYAGSFPAHPQSILVTGDAQQQYNNAKKPILTAAAYYNPKDHTPINETPVENEQHAQQFVPDVPQIAPAAPEYAYLVETTAAPTLPIQQAPESYKYQNLQEPDKNVSQNIKLFEILYSEFIFVLSLM